MEKDECKSGARRLLLEQSIAAYLIAWQEKQGNGSGDDGAMEAQPSSGNDETVEPTPIKKPRARRSTPAKQPRKSVTKANTTTVEGVEEQSTPENVDATATTTEASEGATPKVTKKRVPRQSKSVTTTPKPRQRRSQPSQVSSSSSSETEEEDDDDDDEEEEEEEEEEQADTLRMRMRRFASEFLNHHEDIQKLKFRDIRLHIESALELPPESCKAGTYKKMLEEIIALYMKMREQQEGLRLIANPETVPKDRSIVGRFSKQEQELIMNAVDEFCSVEELTHADIFPYFRERTPDKSLKAALKRFHQRMREVVPYRNYENVRMFILRKLVRKNHQNKDAWTDEDNERLVELVKQHGPRFVHIGKMLGRVPDDCQHKYLMLQRKKKGFFTVAEDAKIITAVLTSLKLPVEETEVLPNVPISPTVVAALLNNERTPLDYQRRWNILLKYNHRGNYQPHIAAQRVLNKLDNNAIIDELSKIGNKKQCNYRNGRLIENNSATYPKTLELLQYLRDSQVEDEDQEKVSYLLEFYEKKYEESKEKKKIEKRKKRKKSQQEDEETADEDSTEWDMDEDDDEDDKSLNKEDYGVNGEVQSSVPTTSSAGEGEHNKTSGGKIGTSSSVAKQVESSVSVNVQPTISTKQPRKGKGVGVLTTSTILSQASSDVAAKTANPIETLPDSSREKEKNDNDNDQVGMESRGSNKLPIEEGTKSVEGLSIPSPPACLSSPSAASLPQRKNTKKKIKQSELSSLQIETTSSPSKEHVVQSKEVGQTVGDNREHQVPVALRPDSKNAQSQDKENQAEKATMESLQASSKMLADLSRAPVTSGSLVISSPSESLTMKEDQQSKESHKKKRKRTHDGERHADNEPAKLEQTLPREESLPSSVQVNGPVGLKDKQGTEKKHKKEKKKERHREKEGGGHGKGESVEMSKPSEQEANVMQSLSPPLSSHLPFSTNISNLPTDQIVVKREKQEEKKKSKKQKKDREEERQKKKEKSQHLSLSNSSSHTVPQQQHSQPLLQQHERQQHQQQQELKQVPLSTSGEKKKKRKKKEGDQENDEERKHKKGKKHHEEKEKRKLDFSASQASS
eukprot:scaffold1307_cov166-Ochromonas_danica.AAC.26